MGQIGGLPLSHGLNRLRVLTVDASEALQVQQRVLKTKLSMLGVSELRELHDTLREARQVRLNSSYRVGIIDDLLEVVRREIDAKQDERHHTQVMAQGSHILIWTKRAVLAAVVVPILLALIAEIPFSKLLRASPMSSEQNQASVAPTITPTVVESASTQSPVSPTPEEASTPAQTPIKFPPPAP